MMNKEKFKQPVELFKSDVVNRWKVPKSDLVTENSTKKINNKNIDFVKLQHMITSHAEKLNDAEGIMELLPDLEIVKEILISNILSPKDLKEAKLNITVSKNAPPELAEIIRTHFTSVYNIEKLMPEILGKALFTKGSYVILPLPPTLISRMIGENTYGLESIISVEDLDTKDFTNKRLPNIGILYNKNTESNITDSRLFAMEEISEYVFKDKNLDTYTTNIGVEAKELIELTDNPLYLLYPTVKNKTAKNRIKRALESRLGIDYGLEAINKNKFNNKNKTDYIDRAVKYTPSVSLSFNPDDLNDDLNPIIITLPPEAVIPIHIPGEPSNHVGYLIFTDTDTGSPLSYVKSSNKFKELSNRLKNNVQNQAYTNTLTASLGYVSSTSSNITGDRTQEDNRTIFALYKEQFENKIKEAIEKGSTGQTVEVADPGELYKIMFARQLGKQKTRVIYVPAEMLSYIAFNYNETGMGISLIEKTKLYASFRAILMFASIMAGVKSSINRRELTITLNEEDPDPTGTIESIMNEYISLQSQGAPWGRLDPIDIVDSLQRAGLQYKIIGSDRYPTTDITVNEAKQEVTPPNKELTDDLKDIHYRALWVEPDTINFSTNVETTATATTTANLLQAKRYNKVQNEYEEKLSELIRKYIRLRGPLYKQIADKYSELKSSESLTLNELIDSVSVALPKADSAEIDAQSIAFDKKAAFIDKLVEIFISEEMLKDLSIPDDQILNTIADIKLSVGNLLKRQYARSENMLPELDNLLNSEDTNVEELLSAHNEDILKLVTDVLKNTRKCLHTENEIISKQDAEYGTTVDENNNDESNISDTDNNLDDTSNLDENTDNNVDGLDDNPDDSKDNLDEPKDEETDLDGAIKTEEDKKKIKEDAKLKDEIDLEKAIEKEKKKKGKDNNEED